MSRDDRTEFPRSYNRWRAVYLYNTIHVETGKLKQVSLEVTPSKCMPPPYSSSHTLVHSWWRPLASKNTNYDSKIRRRLLLSLLSSFINVLPVFVKIWNKALRDYYKWLWPLTLKTATPPLIWWIFVSSFNKNTPLSTHRYRAIRNSC